ncbi:MAG: hypothetical protein ACO3F3_19005, partial [Gemmataceae bacterium]
SDPSNAKAFWYDTDTQWIYIWKYAAGVGVWERVLASGPAGPSGPSGPAGAQGIQGIQGIQGLRGATILSGTSDPTTATAAVDGDYFFNTVSKTLFGPRTTVNSLVTWGTGVSLKGDKGDTGDAGPQGDAGAAGAQGPRGYSVLNGGVDPISSDGVDGDFWINRATWQIFGPKASGLWGAGYTLKGADSTVAGPAGPAGANGLNGTNGTNGLDGKTILNGSVTPTNTTGVVGDFYIQTIDPPVLWGPKEVAGWPSSGIALTGPKGDKGDPGVAGTAGANGVGFSWKGDYNDPAISILTFNINDVVEFDGSAYICTKNDTTDILPTNTSNWELLAARGEQGPEGAAGITDIAAVTPLNWDLATTTLKINDGTSQGQVLSWNGANWAATKIDPPIVELSGLNDVQITNAKDGETLVYDLNASKWVNGTPVSALDDLSDVEITNVQSNEVLLFDGSNWVNGKSVSALDDLSDVSITNPEILDNLVFDGTNWVNSPNALDNLSDVVISSPEQDQSLV